MLIGELAKRSGFSPDTIRFYEKKGLIRLDKKDRRPNNYKEYPEEVLKRLLLVRDLKMFGFTLDEIGELMFLSDYEHNICDGLPEKVRDKLVLIDQKIDQLLLFKQKLAGIVDQCRKKSRVKVEELSGEPE